ncbi:MAG: glycoside hydrolase family 20 zincin-like fold domain-containing protein [Melioribacteraceae bacterium]
MTKKIFIIVLFLCGVGFAQIKRIMVVPEPKEYQFTDEKFLLKDAVANLNLFCKSDEPLSIALGELKQKLSANYNVSWKKTPSASNISFGIPTKDKKFKELCRKNNLLPTEQLGDEGYLLLIDNKKIIASANNSIGLFYAVQTLLQLLNSSDNGYLQGVKILDYPSLKLRAVMDDISRGPVPTMDYMKYQIRRLASLKINAFSHYVEHVVKTKSHPEFAPEDGSLTIENWKELSDYGKKYNVTLIGSFQSFGHFGSVLASPKYAHLGESGTLISPVLKESYDFLEDIYKEMLPAFNAPFFNVNCDETFDLGKGASKKLVDSLGYDGVFRQHIMKIYNIFKKLNSKIMIWGDIPLEYPNLLKSLPKDIFIGTWVYDDLDSFEKYIKPFKENEFRFVVCPGVLNSSKLFPQYYQTVGNIKNFVKEGYDNSAVGMLNTVWDDGGAALFANDWYGVSYAADKSWNPNSSDSTDFDLRLSKAVYGSDDQNYTKAIWKLAELSLLEPTDAMNDKVLFEKLIPDSGKSARVSVNDWQKVINITHQAETLLNKTMQKNYEQDQDFLVFVCRLYASLGKERFRIISAAEKYAQAFSTDKESSKLINQYLYSAIDSIDQIIADFTKLRNDFEKLWLLENRVYSLNRIIDKYDEKIKQYAEVKSKLNNAIRKNENKIPLLNSDEIGLGITMLPGKYFREWLMITPFDILDTQKSSKTDFLREMGGERNAIPKVTQEIFFDGNKHRWSRTTSPYQDIVSLKETFPLKQNNAVVYAFATIDSPTDTLVKALVGCDDAVEVFINGDSRFQEFSKEKLKVDEHSFSLPLKKGINNLMLKVFQTDGDWAFSFRLADCEVRSRKNRYKIIEGN